MKKPSAYRRLLQSYSNPEGRVAPVGLLLLGTGRGFFRRVLRLLGGVSRVLGGVGSILGARRGAGSGSGVGRGGGGVGGRAAASAEAWAASAAAWSPVAAVASAVCWASVAACWASAAESAACWLLEHAARAKPRARAIRALFMVILILPRR